MIGMVYGGRGSFAAVMVSNTAGSDAHAWGESVPLCTLIGAVRAFLCTFL